MRTRFLVYLFVCSAAAQTTVTVDKTVTRAAVKRFGINLSFLSFWDSGQMMKNLVYRNPGFEPMLYQSVMRCATGSATTFTDDHVYSSWTNGFWNGASFELIRNGSQLRSGAIVNFTGPSGANGSTYTFDSAGAVPQLGDLIIVRKRFTGGSAAGWAVNAVGGGAALDETSDLPPGTAGVQCIRLNALSPGASVGLASYFDSTPGRAFVQLTGPHRISFLAKGAGGNNQVIVSLNRSGQPNAVYQTVALSPGWNTYNVDFTGNDTGASVGTVQLLFSVQGASVLLDDVSVKATNSDPTNQTVFRDPVVNALKSLQPGIIRFWGSQLGDSLDNQIAPVSARRPSGYSAFTSRHDDLAYGLHEFLQLCETVGAEPWYVVPIVTGPAEASQLIEYLSGPATSTYGAKRAALGHPAPWTSVFPKIHLEFGNESWNSVFKGGLIEYPDAYGSRAQTIFGAMRANPSFAASNFDLIVGGQYDYVGRTTAINANCNNHDTLALAPYISATVDSFGTMDDLFGPLFAEPQFEAKQGQLRQESDLIAASPRPVPLAVYETNLGTVGGVIPQTTLDQYLPSLGAGVAMASHMLTMLQTLGIRNQNLYALPQYQYLRPDGKQAKIWGSVVDMGVTDRKRPQYLALQLINQALAGDMITASLSANAPTWNQPLVNGIQLSQANYLQAFAFSQSTHNALVLINLHRSSSLPVRFAGGNVPHGTVTLKSLQGSAPTLTNEDQQNVAIATQTLTNFNPANVSNLPPYSVSVLFWEADGGSVTPPVTNPPVTNPPVTPPTTTPPATGPQIAGLTVTGVTNWGATINWTTNVPTTTAVRYGSTPAYGGVNGPTTWLTTQHSVLISGLANGTAYNVQAFSTDASGTTVTSANLTFSTLDLIPPAISNIQASESNTAQAVITWKTDKASDSQVDYGASAAYGSSSALDGTQTVNHSVTLTGLTPGTWHYRAKSRDASGNLAASVDITMTISGYVAAPAPPLNIGYLSAWNISGSGARITWATDRFADTQVEYGSDPALKYPSVYHDPTLSDHHQADLNGLAGTTVYYYRVTSMDASGSRGVSPILSFATLGSSLLPNLSTININVTGPGTAVVTWTTDKPTDGQAEYGRTASFGMWSAWTSTMSTQHQALLQWLQPGVNYFRVRSNDGAGNIAISGGYSFTMP